MAIDEFWLDEIHNCTIPIVSAPLAAAWNKQKIHCIFHSIAIAPNLKNHARTQLHVECDASGAEVATSAFTPAASLRRQLIVDALQQLFNGHKLGLG